MGGWGSRGGQRGVKGGTWKFPKLGPTHRWLSVGVYICTYVMYLHTYVRFCNKKLDLDPHIDPHILTICGQFFLGNG